MSREDEVSVRRASPGDLREVTRFEAAFDYGVIAEETRRFLADERHHLLLAYVDDSHVMFEYDLTSGAPTG